jgi:hypothetical protein
MDSVPPQMLTGVGDDVLTAISTDQLRVICSRHQRYLHGGAECRGCYDYFKAGWWSWPCGTFRAAAEELTRRGVVFDGVRQDAGEPDAR